MNPNRQIESTLVSSCTRSPSTGTDRAGQPNNPGYSPQRGEAFIPSRRDGDRDTTRVSEDVAKDAGKHENQEGEGTGRGRGMGSKAELFMSRLEGNRGPQNRLENVAMFRRILNVCPAVNNSANLRDDCGGVAVVTDQNRVHSSDLVEASGGVKRATVQKAEAIRDVLAERAESHAALVRLMSVTSGSYMLSPEADGVKIRLGRKNGEKQRT